MTAYKTRRSRRSARRDTIGSSGGDTPRTPHEKERLGSLSNHGVLVEGKAAKHHLGKRQRGGSIKHRDAGGSLTPNTPATLGGPYVTAPSPQISSYVPSVRGTPSVRRGPPPPPDAPPQQSPMSEALNLVGTVGSLGGLFKGNNNNSNSDDGDDDGHRRGGRVRGVKQSSDQSW